MKIVLNCKIMWLIVLLPVLFWASVDQEVIVLFKSGVIQMPSGKDTASLNEIAAPQNIIACLQEIKSENIIKAIPNFDRADTLRITEDGWEARLPDWFNLYVVDTEADRDSAIAELAKLSEVIYAEKNEKAEPLYVEPNDPGFDRQWNLNDPSGYIGMDVMRAWDLAKGNNSFIIGITDMGVRTSEAVHEDLEGKVFGDDSYSEHGTRVAGIAGALTNNNKGIAGVDWYARLNIQDYGNATVPELAQVIYEAVNAGAKIINCS